MIASVAERLKISIEAKPENLNPVAELRMSGAGDCLRAMVYEGINGRKPIKFDQAMRMKAGNVLHDWLQEEIKLAYGDDFHAVEEELILVTPEGQEIKGHPDGAFADSDELLEVKTVSIATFTLIVNTNAPLESHVDQSSAYAFVLKKKKVRILYLCRDNWDTREFVFELEQETIDRVMKKYDLARSHIGQKTIPQRPYTDKSAPPCWFCDWKEECYVGFSKEVAEASDGIPRVSDPNLNKWAEVILEANKTRLDAEKREKIGRFELGRSLWNKYKKNDYAFENNVKVTLKVGANDNLICTVKQR